MILPALPQAVPADMRRALAAAVPDFDGASVSIAGRGFHSLALEIDGTWIAKFPEGPAAEEALRREARLLSTVRPLVGLPVPDMTIHDRTRLFSLHRKLVGDSLGPDAYAGLDACARARLAADLGRFLAELHAIDPSVMQAAGARRIEVWDTSDPTLEPVWSRLPSPIRTQARQAIADYRQMGPDPLGERYGFFDAHGWNMAFDHGRHRLNGMFDFADSGVGPIHREFAPVSLVDADLVVRTASAYEALSARKIDLRRVFLTTAAMRLSEFAGAIETNANVEAIRGLVVGWFEQNLVR